MKVAANGRVYGTAVERFWHNVPADRTADGCWLWQGTQRGGYGRVYDGTRQAAAHRFSYELLVGSIPEGLVIDHLCRTPLCVNPAHLEPVTAAENIRRGIPRNSKVTHCPANHVYSDQNTYRPPSTGKRMCRTCLRSKPGGSQYRMWQRHQLQGAL